MNQDKKPNHQLMKGMWIAMAVCCSVPIIASLVIGGGFGAWFSRSSQPASSPQFPSSVTTNLPLKPATNWQDKNHVHGLAVASTNPNLIYVATHNGLVQRSETRQWVWMQPEQERADYMGFTADPSQPSRFYASGHPQTGGNLGFQMTEDGAKSWKPLSLPGVDFHALAIAPSNPQVFYGFPASGAQGLHVSRDGGQTWIKPQAEGLKAPPFHFVVDPGNADHVFAVTQAGLYESSDQGESWTVIPATQTAPIVGLAMQRENNRLIMYGYRIQASAEGIYRSLDGGKTWEPWGTGTQGLILYIATAPSNPKLFYAVNDGNQIFQSQDSGKTWQKLS